MNGAAASLVTLGLVVVFGCLSRLNVGVLSLLLAFALGRFFCGMSVAEIVSGFPSSLFLHLAGITLLFSIAGENGTLNRIAWRTVKVVRADPRLVTLLVFGLAAAIASSGAGNFATGAMLAPVAMGVAARLGVSPFLMAVMLVSGASAGALSPVAPTGVVANDLMGRMGLGGNRAAVYLYSLAAHAAAGLLGYVLLGGFRLHGWKPSGADSRYNGLPGVNTPLSWQQRFTIVAVAVFVVAAVGFHLDVGIAAFAAAAFLILVRAADEGAALKGVPWGVILMVCGVTVLVKTIQAAGGMDLFARILSGVSGPAYLPGLAAVAAGVVSIYASSIGVVLPALLPAIPSLVASFGGGNPLMVAYSINIGAHLVDVSPLSPLGAMCLAYASSGEDRASLFRKLMAAGWVMALFGGLLCQLMFGYR